MELDFDAMVEVFGEPNERRSHPDRHDYWFDYRRTDGVAVQLIVNAFECRAIVGVDYGGTAGTSLVVDKCDRVRVLEAERRTIEVVSTEYSLRCFLSLDGETLMTVDVPAAQA